MEFAKSFLMGTGAVVLAGLVLTLMAPKAAHAIAATAVQVENTVSSPVPTQTILPGIPFVQSCSSTGIGCSMAPAVPSGFIFHATQQNIAVNANSNVTVVPFVDWNYTTSGQGLNVYENLPGPVPGNSFNALVDHDWYIDGGTEPHCSFAANVNSTSTMQCVVTGYLTH